MAGCLSSITEVNVELDFNRLRTTLMLEGEPDRVPLVELKMDQDVKDAFMGRPVTDAKTDVEFWAVAGYDYIRLRPPYGFPGEKQTGLARYSVYQEGPQKREWAIEGKGAISSLQDFESYPWPDPQEAGYWVLDEAAEHLRPGMKIIGAVNGIFEHVWWLMGFENFCFSLVEQPDLVEAMFERVGSFTLEVFTTTIEHEGVGAMWMSDDLAYYSGPMINPQYYRRYLFPWYRRMATLCREKDMPFLFHS
ncbi:MAG: uroporphyrinogen decarboxylase family protein, partial [Anaerolineae bacterium]